MRKLQINAIHHISLLIIIVSIFALDIFTSDMVVHWFFYIVPAFFASRTKKSAVLYFTLLVIFICLMVGYFYSSYGNLQTAGLLNRSGGFVVIAVLSIISLKQYAVFGKLIESESRFRKLAASLPQLIWTATRKGTLDYFNERHHDFLGIVKNSDDCWEYSSVVFADDVKKTETAWKLAVKNGNTFTLEHRLNHRDGSVHWYFSRAVPIYADNGKVSMWYGFTTNIDQVKESELFIQKSKIKLDKLTSTLEQKINDGTKRVRELSKELTIAEQKERLRFSGILHDNLLQILFSVKMHLDVFEFTDKEHAEEVEFNFLKSLITKAIYEAKALVLELNPPILKSEGLESAIQWLTCHMAEMYGLEINLNIPQHITGIKETDRILIIQLLRELLFNIVKHAGTKNVWITAEKRDNAITITIKDNGIGFDSDTLMSLKGAGIGSGLSCVMERLRLFDGNLTICSKPHEGTFVTLFLPVETDLIGSML